MPFSDYLLYRIAKPWPSPVRHVQKELGTNPADPDYHWRYARRQMDKRVREGFPFPLSGLEILEIGCGHGGICCFLAAAGAKRVVGIDLSTETLELARNFVARHAEQFGPQAKLPVEFLEMNAYDMQFPPESFDLVLAENAFEHFMQPQLAMEQSFRILRPGGRLYVPIFSSILSKNALHLKNGLKVPWANWFFSEKTIIAAMQRLAKDKPELFEYYPGLKDNPQRVYELRRHKDLNDITHKKFRAMAREVGFEIESFRPLPTRFGKLFSRIPFLRNSVLGDIFSFGAKATLRKPAVKSST